MRVADNLRTLEKALEREVRDFFVLLGAHEAPEGWPCDENDDRPEPYRPPAGEPHRVRRLNPWRWFARRPLPGASAAPDAGA